MSLQNVQAEIAELLLYQHFETLTVSPAENLAIYSNNIQSSLINTLKNTYPLIVKLVGEDFFKVTAREYIEQHPSRSSNMHDYGEYFSRFLAHYPPVKNLIYLVEVAEFEWICHSLYFAADHNGFDRARLRNISSEQYENLHFMLHPASCVMKFHYPILDIIDLCKHNPDTQIDINAGGLNMLIIRRNLELMLVPLENADFAFLHTLQQNYTLSEALTAAQHHQPNFDLNTKLSSWIEDKTLVDCDVALIPKFHRGIQEKMEL